MANMTLSFEIPQDLLASLKIGILDLSRDMRIISAISYFREKKLSLGKAAQLAGLNRLDFIDILARKGIDIFDYDESALESDLKGIAQLKK